MDEKVREQIMAIRDTGVDLLSVSTAIDKLIASGAFCINDIRKLIFTLNLETNQSCKIKGNYCPKCGQKADFSILEQAKEGSKQNEKQ